MRLLLIEDEPTLRESVAKKLRRSGYEMDDCGDGETALELERRAVRSCPA